jgi:hypothetical protein
VELGGKRIAFTGDLIYGPGQIHDMYSLQKAFAGMRGGYWGFGGAVEDLKSSLDRVLAKDPGLLIPSHGVIMRDPPRAVAELKQNLDAVMENYLTTCAWRANMPEVYKKSTPAMLPPLPAVPYPKWCRDITYTTKAIVADDKSVFLSVAAPIAWSRKWPASSARAKSAKSRGFGSPTITTITPMP